MFNKITISFLCAVSALLFFTTPKLEAGYHHRRPHCHRSTNVSLNVSPTYVAQTPTYLVESPAYIFERRYEPVYTVPVREVVVYQQPVYRPVYVAPQPRLFTGLSFNWFFH